MRWPWRRSEEEKSRDAVRQVIETHRRAALDVIGAAANIPPRTQRESK